MKDNPASKIDESRETLEMVMEAIRDQRDESRQQLAATVKELESVRKERDTALENVQIQYGYRVADEKRWKGIAAERDAALARVGEVEKALVDIHTILISSDYGCEVDRSLAIADITRAALTPDAGTEGTPKG